MIRRIDRPVASLGMWIFFMLGKTKKNFFANRQTGVYLGTNTRMDTGRERERERGRERVREREREREGGREEDERRNWCPGQAECCYALFYVCIALKNIWFPSKVKCVELWTTRRGRRRRRRRSAFTPKAIFFARVEVFTLCFLCCQWCCVWMLNILKIKPNVGRRRVYLKREKRRHISATGDDLEPFY